MTTDLRFEFRQQLHKSELEEWEPEELVDLGLLEIHVVEDEPGQLLHPGFREKYSVSRCPLARPV